ncbi:MAG TPA: hypothetical protein DCZ95_10455 [Verrucomicrobia bacterium]|nr:MAG: hypothetical protein A2X46_18685 [Lentisphaerae bacterium GWF2_57_35]HBA84503.1 hypothetical protein [Verrucomicrobiota bacterium]
MAATCLGLVLFSGCEWGSSGGDGSFNTSQGAGVQLNFSGVYSGTMSGGKLVASKGGAPVTSLVIFQAGNSLEITDNNGSTYTGNIGSPGAVADGVNGSFSTGAELAQAQVSFTGNDNSAGGREINFVGVIHAVAVKDIQGTTSTDTDSSSTSSSDGGTRTTTTSTFDATNKIDIITVTEDIEGSPETRETTTTVRYDRETGVELSRTQTVTIKNDSSSATTSTTTYEITEANTQYRLQGNWIEVGAGSSGVDGLSAGTAGLIQTTTTTTGQ